MNIRKVKKIFVLEHAFGFVEALVALAVVGTGMVVITALSLRSMKLARRNELQDVSVQVAVEAMDFMKNPSELIADQLPGMNETISYRLKSDFRLEKVGTSELNADSSSCHSSSPYIVSYLYDSDILVCQQIIVTKVGDMRYDLRIIVVWQSVGDYEKRVITGYRYGDIIL